MDKIASETKFAKSFLTESKALFSFVSEISSVVVAQLAESMGKLAFPTIRTVTGFSKLSAKLYFLVLGTTLFVVDR